MTIFIQLLLAIIITTLSLLIAVIGIQAFHLLHEFRLTVKKLNHILDNTQLLSDTITRPVTAVNRFFTEVRDLVNHTDDQLIDQTPDKVLPQPRQKFFRRIFHRSGLPLRPS